MANDNEVDVVQSGPEPAPRDTTRRSLLAALAAGVGGASFFGPWKVNHAWAQAAQKKPLVIGLTMDASGQYAASGVEEIKKFELRISTLNFELLNFGFRAAASPYSPS